MVSPILTRLQKVLANLRGKLVGKTEKAYRDRDEADKNNEHHAQTYAAGEAHAYGQAEQAVREAQDEAR